MNTQFSQNNETRLDSGGPAAGQAHSTERVKDSARYKIAKRLLDIAGAFLLLALSFP